MSCLAVADSAPTIRPLPEGVLSRLGNGKASFYLKLEVVKRILANPGKHITQAYAREAARVGKSAEAVKKWYNDARKHGARALVDHRLCGTVGCGLEECGNGARKSRLPPAAVEHWQSLIESNQSMQRTGERAGLWAWRKLMNLIRAGECIPGVGDWRAIHRYTRPGAPVPRACPFSQLNPPDGWSYQNFQAKPRNRVETLAAQRGLLHLNKELPMVRTDWGKLRPLEVVFVDDKRFDFPVWLEVDGQVRIVELWALFAMDAATRRVLWCNLFPRYQRENNTWAGISFRDTQHLVAAILGTYGYPTEYQMQIVGENAAAAFSEGFKLALPQLTGGQVNIRTTGLWDGSSFVGSFIESGGNPNGKGILESFFNRLDITLGDVRGQLGGHYLLKPGSTPGRLKDAQATARAIQGKATAEEMGLLLNLESLAGVRGLLLNKFAELEHQHDHEFVGFERTGLWRYGPNDPDWKALNDPDLITMQQSLGAAGLDAFLRAPGRSTWRMETPVERWNRLHDPSHFRALDAAAFSEMWMDHGTVEYKGAGALKVKLRGGTFHFIGTKHSARAGQRVVVVFDSENPTVCALRNEAGQFLGTMAYQGLRAYHDTDALREQIAAKQDAKNVVLQGLRERRESPAALRQLANGLDVQLDVLATIETRAALPAESSAGVDDTMDALTTRRRAKKRTESGARATNSLLAEAARALTGA